jgi:hypothetical protein
MVKPPRKFNLWILVYGITSALQVFRGDVMDEIVFLGATALLILVALLNYNVPAGRRFHRYAVIARYASLVLIVLLTLLPRHSTWVLLVLLVLLPLMLIAAWVGTYESIQPQTKRIRRTRWLWTIWAVMFCLWEFLANILGQLAHNLELYPTISILLDPQLDHYIGRLVFVSLWIWAGYTLLFRLREPKE